MFQPPHINAQTIATGFQYCAFDAKAYATITRGYTTTTAVIVLIVVCRGGEW
ncbi:MAG: hypothetical protein KDB68_05950 [Planctomycetes bacterium]|nr:hypothetical protein [Planctomycetota bacterium]